MPSFEFVIPENFIFIPVNLSFISFCFFISFILSKIFRSKILFFVFLLFFLSIAYYDILIKFTVKSFYSLTQMNSKIYIKAQKDENSKIDSLSMTNLYIYPLKYSTTLSDSEKEEIKELHEGYISRFIDISTYAYKFNKYIYNIERIYLNSNEKIDFGEKARFEIVRKKVASFLPKIYKKYEYRFIDKKTNLVIATAFNIYFVNSYDKFRNRYLYWSYEKENEFNILPIQNFDIIYKKVFGTR